MQTTFASRRALRALTATLLLLSGTACSGRRTDAGPGPGTDSSASPEAGTDAATGRAEVTVLSWNIEQFPMSATAVDDVAAIITDMEVDLVGIQEISDPAGFDDLVATLPEYDGVYAEDDPSAFLRVGLLYRTDRVAIANVETLFPTDWWAFPRPVLKADVTVTAPGSPPFDFVFLVLHLKAGVDPEDQDRREAACIALEAYVSGELTSGTEADFVLVGDWNDRLTDAVANNVFHPFLDDPQTYTFLTLALAEAGIGSYIPFDSMIDHILVSADALDEYGAGTTEVLFLDVTIPGYLDTISDHRPVLSRFEL